MMLNRFPRAAAWLAAWRYVRGEARFIIKHNDYIHAGGDADGCPRGGGPSPRTRQPRMAKVFRALTLVIGFGIGHCSSQRCAGLPTTHHVRPAPDTHTVTCAACAMPIAMRPSRAVAWFSSL